MSVQTITTNPVFTANGTDVEKFGASLRGQLLTPDDEGYDQARAHGLTVSVRGGGHSFAGRSVCDGGLMIDLSPMKGILSIPHGGQPALNRVYSSVRWTTRPRRNANVDPAR